MRKKRDRKQQKIDSEMHYGGMAESKPSDKAKAAFNHKPYTVSDYLRKVGVDVSKGVDASGADGSKDRERA